MKKLIGAGLLLAVIVALQTKAFAGTLNCEFKDPEIKVAGVETLRIADDALVINNTESIPLEHTRIKCGHFGKQHRFDGLGKDLQIILKSCTDEAALEGHLIDAINSKTAAVVCHEEG